MRLLSAYHQAVVFAHDEVSYLFRFVNNVAVNEDGTEQDVPEGAARAISEIDPRIACAPNKAPETPKKDADPNAGGAGDAKTPEE